MCAAHGFLWVRGMGLRHLSTGESRSGRAALATAHLRLLRDIARVPTSVHTSILLRELEQRPLDHLWWRRAIRFWNTLAALHMVTCSGKWLWMPVMML